MDSVLAKLDKKGDETRLQLCFHVVLDVYLRSIHNLVLIHDELILLERLLHSEKLGEAQLL